MRSRHPCANHLPRPARATPATAARHYELAVRQFRGSLGPVDPRTGRALETTLWGYDGRCPVHLVHFRVVGHRRFDGEPEATGALREVRWLGDDRRPGPDERGPKDTVRVPPRTRTRIVARLDRPGRYVWHCHILSHEDHEMMRPFVVQEG